MELNHLIIKINKMKNDNYKETRKITEVTIGEEWHFISMDGTCCGMKASYGVTPKVGDMLTVHTKGGSFGTIRGMDLNGHKIFWKTDVSGWRYFSSHYPKWNSNLEIVWADGTEDIFNWTKPNAEQIDFDIDCKPIKWRYACR